MHRIVHSLVLVLVFELCSHGETKTIVFNSYTNGPPAERTMDVQAQNDSTDGEGVTRLQASESSGRAFSSGGSGGFPYSIHPDYLSKPVAVARPDAGYKTPKYIVYPSYSQNVANSAPYYNAPVAMDRFAPGEAYGGTLYKLKKQRQPFVSSGGPVPFGSIAAASSNSPVVSVQSPNLLRPAASDNSPVTVLALPSGSSDGPPGPPTSPPSSAPPDAASGPPPPPSSPPIFMPTPVPSNSGEDTAPPSPAPSPPSTDAPEMDALVDSQEVPLYPPNSHSGYLPPPKKRPITAYLPPTASMETSPPDMVVSPMVTPSADLFKFPPNLNSSYLPPSDEERSKNPVTSYLPPPSGETDSRSNAAASSAGASYKGTEELFKFPPNVNSSYTASGAVESSKLSGTSYLPPASGDPRSPANLQPNSGSSQLSTGAAATGAVMSDELFKFPPNIQTAYLPSKQPQQTPVTSYLPPPSGNPHALPYQNPSPPSGSSPPSQVPPGDLYKFPPNVHAQYLPPYPSVPRPNSAVTSYLPPASGIPGDDSIGTIPVGPGKPQYLPPQYSDNGPPAMQPAPMTQMAQMAQMAQMDSMKMPQMMQPMMAGQPMAAAPMAGPPTGPSGMGDDHDHHHHHHHDHDFPYFTGFDHDHYPDIIYDHDHYHHHHDDPTTTPAPPPPPPPPPAPPAPETPRLKNYSYYYLSRTLWYVPLYFTLYFTFYVAVLIIRSIARHKVNLPNNWVANARSFGSIRDLSNAEVQRKATMMATFTMRQIEDFREKYL